MIVPPPLRPDGVPPEPASSSSSYRSPILVVASIATNHDRTTLHGRATMDAPAAPPSRASEGLDPATIAYITLGVVLAISLVAVCIDLGRRGCFMFTGDRRRASSEDDDDHPHFQYERHMAQRRARGDFDEPSLPRQQRALSAYGAERTLGFAGGYPKPDAEGPDDAPPPPYGAGADDVTVVVDGVVVTDPDTLAAVAVALEAEHRETLRRSMAAAAAQQEEDLVPLGLARGSLGRTLHGPDGGEGTSSSTALMAMAPGPSSRPVAVPELPAPAPAYSPVPRRTE
ncbi:hypothetical protein H9P43_006994 [Blastocladiella emersonii ATCC 22665]|nr:hypothetical protein H9P43_006994 [Blastocladiella emersonii ATCC 22665]